MCFGAATPTIDPLTAPLDAVIGLGDVVDQGTRSEAPTGPEPAIDRVRSSTVAQPDGPVADHKVADLSDVDVMLSMLAAEHRHNEPASDLVERFADRPTRVAVMVGGTVVVGAVLFAILTAVGAFL